MAQTRVVSHPSDLTRFRRPHLKLGELLVKEGKLDAAREQFQLTLRLDPRNAITPKYLSQ